MRRLTIFIAERDPSVRQDMRDLLLRQGWGVLESPDASGALHALRQKQRPDLFIISAALEGAGDGVEIARQIRQWDRRIPLILTASNGSEELAVAALRAGVNDYFKQPVSFADLLAAVRRCLSACPAQESSAQDETAANRILITPGPGFVGGPQMIGESAAMREIKAYIGRVAPTDSNVLITGETGTGKELVAELIHRNSPRSRSPLVSINSAAIPDSLLESELFGYEKGAFTGAHSSRDGQLKAADGGTVFFDEIGDMSLFAQAKLLRAIESRQVQRLGGRGSVPLNIRIIAATNQDLERRIAEEKFRTDLYFRLNVARVSLPPLRDRKEDLALLFAHYIHEMNQRFGRAVEGFTEEALASLLRYDWPGNVRELKNVVEAAFINLHSQEITVMDLPEQVRRQLRQAEGLPQSERDRVLSALLATKWNKSKAAQKLCWSRMTLYRKMAEYHIVEGGKKVGR